MILRERIPLLSRLPIAHRGLLRILRDALTELVHHSQMYLRDRIPAVGERDQPLERGAVIAAALCVDPLLQRGRQLRRDDSPPGIRSLVLDDNDVLLRGIHSRRRTARGRSARPFRTRCLHRRAISRPVDRLGLGRRVDVDLLRLGRCHALARLVGHVAVGIGALDDLRLGRDSQPQRTPEQRDNDCPLPET